MNTAHELQIQAARIEDYVRFGLPIPPHVARVIAAGLRLHSVRVGRMERALDEIVRDAMEENRGPQTVVVSIACERQRRGGAV